jgi:hypothetical protein
MYGKSPIEAARSWRVALSAVGLGLFLFCMISAVYIVGALFGAG